MTGLHPLRDLPLEQLRRRTSIKWAEFGPDVLPLWVAEMDAHPIPAVVEAVDRAMRSGDTGYPAGPHDYAEAFADFASAEWGWQVDPSRAAMAADVMTGVTEAVRLVAGRDAVVVLNPPVYPPFFGYAQHAGHRVVEAPLGHDLRLDLDSIDRAYRSAAAHGPVVHLLCSPHNPSSVIHTREELTALAGLAAEHGVAVVVDEIHAPLVEEGFVPYLSVPGTQGAVVVTSASKGFNLAGFKAALMIGGSDVDLGDLAEVISHGPSHLGMIAHATALREGRDWLRGLRGDLAENRGQVAAELRTLPGAGWNGGDGTYLAWLDLRALDLGDDPAEVLLERARVGLNSGLPFGTGGSGHARLNYATTPDVLSEAFDRIRALI